ncbi:MAG: hypothetical protein IZT56_10100 [Bacteroidetes bacterium]|jgi:hypothetical protein|nr:hypothetical protein [Bacteroidota bacterium]
MKLLMITSVKEFEKDVCKLFKASKIEVYSTLDVQGNKLQKPTNIQDNWFSAQRDTLDSKLFFTFTSEELIDEMLKEVESYNKEKASNNPVKAIVMNIEKHV